MARIRECLIRGVRARAWERRVGGGSGRRRCESGTSAPAAAAAARSLALTFCFFFRRCTRLPRLRLPRDARLWVAVHASDTPDRTQTRNLPPLRGTPAEGRTHLPLSFLPHRPPPQKKKMERFLRPAPPDGDPSTSDRAASTRPKRPLPPGTQTTLRDCAKVVVLDRRDDPATAAAALLPTLTDPAAPPAAQLDALRRLACLRFVDRGLLAGTGVGAAVRRLKRSDDVEVGQVREGRGGKEGAARAHRGRGALTFLSLFTLLVQSAARLVEKWKALVLDELAQARRVVARGA